MARIRSSGDPDAGAVEVGFTGTSVGATAGSSFADGVPVSDPDPLSAAGFAAAARILSRGEPPAGEAGFAAERILSRGEPPVAGAADAGFAPARILSIGEPEPEAAADGAAAALAAGFASACDSAFLGFGASTIVRNEVSMSYQPMSTGPSNSTSARQFMLTVFTFPVRFANRFSSGVEEFTTTHLSVSSFFSRSALSIRDTAISP